MNWDSWSSVSAPGLSVMFILLFSSIQGAVAADIWVAKTPGAGVSIIVSGLIDVTDDETFASVASTLEGAGVVLSSPGGSTIAALNIGTAIRLRQWRTVVPQGATCASACALVWLAGTKRAVGTGGRVGFHASYIIKDGQPMEAGSGNALVGAYLNRLGMRDSAVLYATAASPTEISWLTASDAAAVGINATFDTADVFPTTEKPPPTASGAAASLSAPVGPTGGSTPLTEERMMANLYQGFPASVAIDGRQICSSANCSISLLQKDSWIRLDGKPRQLVVGVVEQEMGCHACKAVLGIAIYRWDYVTWVPETVAPSVMGVGAYGSYHDNISIQHLSGFDPLLLVADAGLHFGQTDESVVLVARVFGTFRNVLAIDTAHFTGGNCDPKAEDCRARIQAEDFQSSVTVDAAPKGGLDVVQRFSAGAQTVPKTWHIEENGDVQPGIGNGNQKTAAQATLNSTSFNDGLADRRKYEAWFSGLDADRREGAAFWAEQRSLKNPHPCIAIKPLNLAWKDGCSQARQLLSPFDTKRKSDPEYRRGWNSL